MPSRSRTFKTPRWEGARLRHSINNFERILPVFVWKRQPGVGSQHYEEPEIENPTGKINHNSRYISIRESIQDSKFEILFAKLLQSEQASPG
jgi:hypothetical protein